MSINCFGIPATYRGWRITQECDDNFYGTGPNYDASYEGPEDGWVSNGEQCVGRTWDDLKDEIDTYIAEHSQAETPTPLSLPGKMERGEP